MREYLSMPNIPNKRSERVKGVIVDYRTDKEAIDTLVSMGIECILSCRVSSLYEAVCGHPDMMIHHLGGNRFITAPEAYEHFKAVIPDADIIKGSKPLKSAYPDDIRYNAASVGRYLFCNAPCTATEILTEYKTLKREILSVKQGYTKCSICVVSENAIITSDAGIYKKAVECKIDALKITEGYIELKGMSYGFIGGATGLIAPDTLAVNGNLKTHPDYNNIVDFCNNYNVNIISLKNGAIYDIGSILPIF